MHSLINYIFESGISIAVLALFYDWVLRREKSFQFNRYYLLGSVAFSIMLPFIHFSWEGIPAQLMLDTILLDQVVFGATRDTSMMTAEQVFLWGYVLVIFALGTRLILKAVPLLILIRQGIKKENFRLVTLKDSSDAFSAFNIIFIGDSIPKEERELILPHEQVHVSEKHSYDMLFLELVSIFLWINPVFHLIKRFVRVNHEYLADAHVVQNSNKDHYIQALANHTVQRLGFSLAHQFHTSSTISRIKMINKQNTKIMKIKQVLPFVLAAALLITLGCEDAAQQLKEQDDVSAAKAISEYVSSNDVYDEVEEKPMPKGGLTEFYGWIAQNLKYPIKARKEGIEGRVFVQFVLDKEGNITDVKAIKGIGGGCDESAVETIKKSAQWNPGKVNGEPVSVRMVLPISFKLPDS